MIKVFVSLLDRTKISAFNYFYIVCMFLYAGSATVFARDLGDIRTLGNAFALCLTLYFYGVNRIKLTKALFVSLAVFGAYAIVTIIRNRLVNPMWISQWLIWLTMAYGICQCFKERLFVVIETVLLHLSIISLFFWIIHLLSPDLMDSIVNIFEFSEPYEEDSNVKANMIIYTINSRAVDPGDFSFLIRNSGFAWEPGAMACFACLGIFCNFLRTDFNYRSYSLWAFLLTLFSTQSTTGSIILLALVVMGLVNNKKYGYLLPLIPVLLLVFNLPFVRDKLFEEVANLEFNDEMLMSGAAGRLFSFKLSFDEFMRHPIIGLGGYTEGTWLAKNGIELATISGIGNMLVYFGAIMTVLFIYLLIKACILIQELLDSKYSWGLIVLIIGMMVSYNLWKQPIFIALWMFGIYGIDYYKDSDELVDETMEEES